jgi:hypothetical protein
MTVMNLAAEVEAADPLKKADAGQPVSTGVPVKTAPVFVAQGMPETFVRYIFDDIRNFVFSYKNLDLVYSFTSSK